MTKNNSMYLAKRLRKVEVTTDDVNLVMNVMLSEECEPCRGAKADFLVKALVNKYADVFKGRYSKLELANIIYAILTEQLCDIPYIVHACYVEALTTYRNNLEKQPIEFYLSTALSGLASLPANWKVFSDDKDESCRTVLDALKGIHKGDLVFPSETNKVVPCQTSGNYLLYVDNSTRWVAYVNPWVASKVQMYSNPVVATSEGLKQGELLLRFIPPLNGVVTDDYVLV